MMTWALIARLRTLALAAWAWSLATSCAYATNVLGYPDFNGDGKSDLVWLTNEYYSAIWLMDGTGPIAAGAVSYDRYFVFSGMRADFNGDGRSDVAWWRQRVFIPGDFSAFSLALMNGVSTTQTLFDDGFLASTPDLDGDGKSDLVVFDGFPRVRGLLRLQLMNGLTPTAVVQYQLASPCTNCSDWFGSRFLWGANSVDFDGDGKDDLMFGTFNGSDGRFAIWLMDGLGVKAAAQYLVDPAWDTTHGADFDGDGKSDLLWQKQFPPTGEFAMWLMDGTGVRDAAVFHLDPAWSVTHVGDFDGDGRADLLWRNSSTAATAIWLMDGLTAKSAAFLHHDPAWRPVTLGDYNGDGKADIVWRHSSGSLAAFWLMNGATPTETRVIAADPSWYPI